ncbi:MAG: hypothetical protein HOQ09_05900 [Gemmatimonadaceae bacterium]|nr:hypothetical protein [Gemmatimonadaceae bacterium]
MTFRPAFRQYAVPALLAALLPLPARAQLVWRPDADWRTLQTPHFTVDYPREYAEWARAMAERLESVRSAVGREVGSLPRGRVTVLVTDPLAVSNGSAWPFMTSPSIIVWPTPPDPRSSIGDARSWPEMLSVHEFAHVAHLTRPSRNPTQAFLARLSPLGLGPLPLKSPRWVIEGYATYVEGRLTGSGRPHGVWRPAVLRQWALEGRLPTYEELSGWGEYQGGSFAYLGGSAFLEWLAARRGDSTLVQLWRRMSARNDRSFDAAFAGLYGDSPRVLYGRFTAELTGKALEIERTLRDSGLVEGTLVQHLSWTTGDPAVSPDGKRVAVVLRSKERPARVVVWRTADEPPDTAAATRARRAARRDPEDVPDIQFWPRPKRAVATLVAANGFAYDLPRFMPDGDRLLVVRYAVRSDGSVIPDLFEWNARHGGVRRITDGANIRAADPSPDGRSAAAIRCRGGSCDLVRVSLGTGAIELLAAGSPTRAYTHPRWSPDGRSIVASVSDSGSWRLVLRDSSGSMRYLGPADGVNRYDPELTPDGRLLHVSEAGGVPNVAVLDTANGATRTLTRVTGAAVAPSLGGGKQVWFLALHAAGYDVRRIALDSAADAHPIALDARLTPAAPTPVVAADTFHAAPLGSDRRYGLGVREYRILGGYALAADGRDATLALSSTDKVGRLGWLAQGSLGSRWRPSGASLAAAWRRVAIPIEGEIFTMAREASLQKPAGFTGAADDVHLRGATVTLGGPRHLAGGEYDARAGASAQQLVLPGGGVHPRPLVFASMDARLVQRGEEQFVSESFVGRATLGRDGATAGSQSFSRVIATVALAAGSPESFARIEGTAGRVAGGAPFERFVVGGAEPSFVGPATVDQWIAMPALPYGMLRGSRFASARASLGGDVLSPYYWIGTAADQGKSLAHWKRVVGVDGSIDVPSVPLLRLPATSATLGVGYSLDAPWRKKTRAYLALRYRP